MTTTHEFDNGVKVYEHHLLDKQKERYRKNNVHEEEEEPLFLACVGQLENGATYVNIGAAVGYYVILAKKRRPDLKVFAYEPLRSHRKYMDENITLNDLARTDIGVYKEGVGPGRGWTNFKVHHYGSKVEIDHAQTNWFQSLNKIIKNERIKTVSLEDVVSRAGGKVDLIQMDIQGLETDVLRGGAKTLSQHVISQLIIGTHGPKIHADCIAILIDAGYEIDVDMFDTLHQPDGILIASCD